MSITRLQQARQMYSTGQRVAKTLDGSRPGYRGDNAYGPSSRSNQATSIGQARSSNKSSNNNNNNNNTPQHSPHTRSGYTGPTNYGPQQPPQQFIGGKSYNVTPETRGERDRATLKQQILNQTTLGGNRIDKYGNTRKSPFKQNSGLGSLLMSGIGMLLGIPGLGLITGGLRNLGGGIMDINNRIQNSDFGRSKNLMDYLDIKKYGGFDERELARQKTMKSSRDLQAKIDAGMYDGFEKPTQTFSFDNSGMQSTNLNNIGSIVAASQMPQGINNSMYGADKEIFRNNDPTDFNIDYSPDGITYYNNDQQPQQGIMSYPSDLATEFQDMAIQTGNYAQNEVGNQLYGKEYDVLNPFEQQQIDTAIETYGTKSDGKLASGTSSPYI
jgi:hypothetical protein